MASDGSSNTILQVQELVFGNCKYLMIPMDNYPNTETVSFVYNRTTKALQEVAIVVAMPNVDEGHVAENQVDPVVDLIDQDHQTEMEIDMQTLVEQPIKPDANDKVPLDYTFAGISASEKETKTADVPPDTQVFEPNLGVSATAVPVIPSTSSRAKRGSKYKFDRDEMTALLKAISWMGKLRQKDGVQLERFGLKMATQNYWTEDYNGNGSIWSKFKEMNMRDDNQGYQRDLLSVKRKWGNCAAAIATYPKKFFEDKNGVTEEEQDFLVKLAAEVWKLANK